MRAADAFAVLAEPPATYKGAWETRLLFWPMALFSVLGGLYFVVRATLDRGVVTLIIGSLILAPVFAYFWLMGRRGVRSATFTEHGIDARTLAFKRVRVSWIQIREVQEWELPAHRVRYLHVIPRDPERELLFVNRGKGFEVLRNVVARQAPSARRSAPRWWERLFLQG